MGRLSGPLTRWYDWVYDHLPDGWFDLRTVPGFVAGLLGLLRSVVLFGLILVLLVLVGAVEPGWTAGAEQYLPWVLLGAGLLGAALVYAFQRYEPVHRRLEDPDAGPRVTLITRLLVYGTFAVLAVWSARLAVTAAIGYLAGIALMTLLFFLPAQARRLVGAAT